MNPDSEYIIKCKHCNAEIVIDEDEKNERKFVCPECQAENEISHEEIIEYEIKEDDDLSPLSQASELKGIKGWLLLPAISLILYLFIDLGEIIQSFEILRLIDPFLTYIPIGIVLFRIIVIILFFTHKKILPYTIIIFFLFNIGYSIFVYFYFNSMLTDKEFRALDSKLLLEVFKSLTIGVVWSLYFLKSKRVKNTFVKKLWNGKEENEKSDEATEDFIEKVANTSNLTDEAVTEKKNSEIGLINFTSTKNIILSLKYFDNFLFYNIKIFGEYYNLVKEFSNKDLMHLITIHLKDQDNFCLENIDISAEKFIRNEIEEIYYYGDKAKMSPELYSKIYNVEFTSNFLFNTQINND